MTRAHFIPVNLTAIIADLVRDQIAVQPRGLRNRLENGVVGVFLWKRLFPRRPSSHVFLSGTAQTKAGIRGS